MPYKAFDLERTDNPSSYFEAMKKESEPLWLSDADGRIWEYDAAILRDIISGTRQAETAPRKDTGLTVRETRGEGTAKAPDQPIREVEKEANATEVVTGAGEHVLFVSAG